MRSKLVSVTIFDNTTFSKYTYDVYNSVYLMHHIPKFVRWTILTLIWWFGTVFVYAQNTQNNNPNIVDSTSNAWGEAALFGIWKLADLWLFFVRLIIAIAVVILLLLISRFFSRFVSKRIRANSIWDDEYTRKVSGLIGEIIFYTLTIFSFLIWFMIIQVDFGWILWGISFGIWFAFKDILGNLIAGILVLTNKEFRLGDIIEVDYMSHTYFGRIEEITIRYTVIRTLDLRKVIVPNLAMVMNPVRTFDGEELVRLETKVTIHYETPVERWLDIIKQAVNSLEFVREKDSTKVMMEAMGDHWLEIKIYFYIDPTAGKLMAIAKAEVNDAIYAAFVKEWIVIPYPHSTITVDHNDKNLIGTMLYVDKETK